MYSEPTTDNHNKSKYRIRTWSWTPTDELTGTESGQDKGSDRLSFLNPIFTIEASFELEIKGPLFFYQEWNESTPHPIPRRESEVLSANIPWIKCFHNKYRQMCDVFRDMIRSLIYRHYDPSGLPTSMEYANVYIDRITRPYTGPVCNTVVGLSRGPYRYHGKRWDEKSRRCVHRTHLPRDDRYVGWTSSRHVEKTQRMTCSLNHASISRTSDRSDATHLVKRSFSSASSDRNNPVSE